MKTEISVTTDVILAHAYVSESPPSSAVCVKHGIRKYHSFFLPTLMKLDNVSMYIIDAFLLWVQV